MVNEAQCTNRGIRDGPSYLIFRVQCECFTKIDLGKNGETCALLVFDTFKNGKLA